MKNMQIYVPVQFSFTKCSSMFSAHTLHNVLSIIWIVVDDRHEDFLVG